MTLRACFVSSVEITSNSHPANKIRAVGGWLRALPVEVVWAIKRKMNSTNHNSFYV